jgi:hypothetical protein
MPVPPSPSPSHPARCRRLGHRRPSPHAGVMVDMGDMTYNTISERLRINKFGGAWVKSAIAFGAIVCFLWMSFGVYAQEDVNHYCLDECTDQGHNLDYCTSLCSTRNESGEETKDMACLSSCLGEGHTTYYCYSSCEIPTGETPQGVGVPESPEE